MDLIRHIDPIWVSIGLGCALGVGLILAMWKSFATIAQGAKWIKERVFTFTCFFWVVNIVCMAYSAQNAGYIFGLYESTGLLVGVALDLLIIAFTQTMLAAKARGETDRALKILLFIVACCLLSTIGNLAHNLHTDITRQTSGVWFQQIIPYAVSAMPLFLIALAYVADLKVNPISRMSVAEYRADEMKRLDFLQVQIEMRERQAGLESRFAFVRAQQEYNKMLRKGKDPEHYQARWWYKLLQQNGPQPAPIVAPSEEAQTQQEEQQSEQLIEQQEDEGNSNIVDIQDYQDSLPEPSTDPQLPAQQKSPGMSTRPAAKSSTGGATNGKQKAKRILQKHPDLNAPELAKKAGISRQYASRIIAGLA